MFVEIQAKGILYTGLDNEAHVINFIQRWLKFPQRTPLEGKLNKRTLTAVLLGVAYTSLVLALDALYLKSIRPGYLLFTLSILCLLGLQINEQIHNTVLSLIASAIFLAAVFYSLITGGGIHDPMVLAYPIVIFIGSLLFGKRASFSFFLVSAVSLILIGFLQIKGVIHTSYGADVGDIVTQVVLIAAEVYLVWISMENMETNLRRAEQSEALLNESYDKTLEGWAKALEFRDRETEGHCRRVTNLSVRLAYLLGLPDDEITLIYRGALLHDIGKMAIPDSILFKPGPLDETEWALMRRHPLYAKEMLENIPYLRAAIPIPYCHHERWDGKGYPQGLKGEEIPLPSRIFTIVDNWEALTSDRPYRKAMAKDEIIGYIEKNAGKIFDPHIVALFIEMIQDSSPVYPAPAAVEEVGIRSVAAQATDKNH